MKCNTVVVDNETQNVRLTVCCDILISYITSSAAPLSPIVTNQFDIEFVTISLKFGALHAISPSDFSCQSCHLTSITYTCIIIFH